MAKKPYVYNHVPKRPLSIALRLRNVTLLPWVQPSTGIPQYWDLHTALLGAFGAQIQNQNFGDPEKMINWTWICNIFWLSARSDTVITPPLVNRSIRPPFNKKKTISHT